MRHTLRDLTNAQWTILDALIPEPERRKDGRGRPWRGRREVLDGILFILRTGAPWVDLPDRYPPYQTCHRRFQQWVRSGVMKGILEVLALDLKLRGALDTREAFIDGALPRQKKVFKGWKNETRQRNQDHDSSRSQWSASGYLRRECYPSRG